MGGIQRHACRTGHQSAGFAISCKWRVCSCVYMCGAFIRAAFAHIQAMIQSADLPSLRALFASPQPFIASAMEAARLSSHTGFNLEFSPPQFRPTFSVGHRRLIGGDGGSSSKIMGAATASGAASASASASSAGAGAAPAPARVTADDGDRFVRFVVAFTEAAHARGLTVSLNVAR
jgi:hypothetical protein